MPFDIPYGNSITADRAAEVVKAVLAEATKSPRNWKLAISVVDTPGELAYFYKMDSTQHGSVTISQNKAHLGAPAPPDTAHHSGRCVEDGGHACALPPHIQLSSPALCAIAHWGG
jgi:uncharacterized protein GlcG (DUF336 family)